MMKYPDMSLWAAEPMSLRGVTPTLRLRGAGRHSAQREGAMTKQSPIRWENPVDECAPFKRRLPRRGEHPPRNDMVV